MSWTEEKINEVYEEVMRAAVTDEEFRAALIAEPTVAIEKLTGEKLPEGFKLKVLEEDADSDMTILLPPMLDDELTDEDMEQVAGGGISDIVEKTKHVDEYWEKWEADGYKVFKGK